MHLRHRIVPPAQHRHHATAATPADHHGRLPAAGQAPVYALEGSIAVTGRSSSGCGQLGVISTAAEVNTLAATVTDTGGCVIVPAFSGLFAPHWRSDARGVIVGLTGTSPRHTWPGRLESTAWQVREWSTRCSPTPVAAVRAAHRRRHDRERTAAQIQADVLDVPVIRPHVIETTCLGAAYAAGLAVGFWPDLDALRANWQVDATWQRRWPADRDAGYRRWRKAVDRTLDWSPSADPQSTADAPEWAPSAVRRR